MFSRIDITKIIKAHYKSLRSLNRPGISLNDIIIFFIIPLLISLLILTFNISIKSQISNLVTALSILAGFLFNLLAVIHTSLTKIKNRINKNNETSLKLIFANEIHSNISYNIIVALLIIIVLVVFGFDIVLKDYFTNYILNKLFNFFCIFLLVHFIFTLLMILNRIYILLDKEED